MALEVLAKPAPFVYGGSFSDYVKEKKKFTRFSTLARFSHVVASTSEEALVCRTEDQFHPEKTIGQLYAEARAQDIGTIDSIELPECTLKTVNLVDIARYIQQAKGEHTIGDVEEDAWENEEEEWESEVEEEDEEKDAMAKPSPLPTGVAFSLDSTSDFLIQTDPTMNDKRRMIVDSHLSNGLNSFQLIALASPPNSTSEFSMYMAFSDATAKNAIESTMAGVKAAAKKAVAALDEADVSEYSSESECELEGHKVDGMLDAVDDVPLESHLRKCVHRFNFAADELETIDMKKARASCGFKDDGSSWLVGDSRFGAADPHLQKIRRNRGSASSWGGGGVLLEPIVPNKASLDRPVNVILPKLSMTPRLVNQW